MAVTWWTGRSPRRPLTSRLLRPWRPWRRPAKSGRERLPSPWHDPRRRRGGRGGRGSGFCCCEGDVSGSRRASSRIRRPRVLRNSSRRSEEFDHSHGAPGGTLKGFRLAAAARSRRSRPSYRTGAGTASEATCLRMIGADGREAEANEEPAKILVAVAWPYASPCAAGRQSALDCRHGADPYDHGGRRRSTERLLQRALLRRQHARDRSHSGQKIRWYVFNLDLSMGWHNFHVHGQRWQFAQRQSTRAASVRRSLSWSRPSRHLSSCCRPTSKRCKNLVPGSRTRSPTTCAATFCFTAMSRCT